jgi:hypothetical protein
MEVFYEIERQRLKDIYSIALKIESKYKRLQLQFLWEFIHTTEPFTAICQSLKQNSGRQYDLKYRIVWTNEAVSLPDKYVDRIHLLYQILEDITTGSHDHNILYQIGSKYLRGIVTYPTSAPFDLFNNLFIEPFINHLLYAIDHNTLVLSYLGKYKQRCEWFQKELLISKLSTDTKKLERILMGDLYGYLFDRGLSFHIEPTSPSGEIDLIAGQQNSSRRYLIEGKVFDGKNRPKANIIKGLHQLVHYLKEHGEDKGYFIIYNMSGKHFGFLSGTINGGIGHLQLHNKNIYYLIVDLFNFKQSASRRGKLESIEITEADLKDF